MSSLLDSVKTQISPDIIRSLALNVGESTGSVQLALQGSSAVMLASLASKAQDQDFLGVIKNLMSSFHGRSVMSAAAGEGSPIANTTTQAGNSFLMLIFGGHLSNITGKIAEWSGMRASSAGCILTAAAPIVLGTLGARVNAEGLSASGLGNMLAGELPRIRSLLPVGVSFPGLPSVGARCTGAEDAVRSKASDWVWPLAILSLLVIGALAWFFNRGNSLEAVVAKTTATAPRTGNAMTDHGGSLGEFFQVALPGGIDLEIPQNGLENKLIVFINNPFAQVSSETWFDFDRILFEGDSAALQPSSEQQLENIASILKAYPNVHVRVGGYTDSLGDPVTNLRLSTDRADNVMIELVQLGVDGSRVDAKGYGEDHLVMDNSTETGPSQNRRIALRVTQK